MQMENFILKFYSMTVARWLDFKPTISPWLRLRMVNPTQKKTYKTSSGGATSPAATAITESWDGLGWPLFGVRLSISYKNMIFQ